ncbi:DNA polymerase I [Beggiatoa leptomitoformis]|uniref:DNA polymerase I n=1 Tax=Beggiatoa leptomitoformis TaxID=288004 RepID=A0A2N9YFF3_9GAMM|nr:DNA polymerase I [Beggiatoa leptomitoformis]ALG68506.1 DNA polymerase I [Beggiatoa leptomitoformis]AUI69156.1 DNA polymerase I [Beggiatoa leptomitoformis]
MTTQNTLILVDGSSYLYRAFHAMPSLNNSEGMPTGAVYGVTNMLRNLLKEYQPTHAAVIFDAKGDTFRHELSADYKATRPPMPPELVEQIAVIHQIVQALGFPLLSVAGVEADDVIGTLAQQAEKAGMEVLIFTGDKDLAQLVNEHITLINTMNNTRLDPQGVKEKFGVTPAQIIDFLSLVGDKVDNVRGVDKVGEKTAAKWLEQYTSLDTIIANSAQIKGKVGENLRAALHYLPLTKALITIRCDVPLSETPQTLTLKTSDNTSLRQIYQTLEFKNWLHELPTEATLIAATAPITRDRHYQCILTETELQTWLKRLAQVTTFAFDTETDGLDYLQAQLVGLSFALQADEAIYIPVAHDYMGAPPQLSRERVLQLCKPLLENPTIGKIGQNIKFDAHILANNNIQLQGIAYDSLLESYVLDSTRPHDMDSLALAHLNIKTTTFEEVAGKGAKQLRFNQVSLEIATDYAAEDADVTWQLHRKLWADLQTTPSLQAVFTDIEMPLIPVLLQMERNGVMIDADKLYAQSNELASRLQTLEIQAHEQAGMVFNLNSPKQLQTILFEKFNLPILEKTPKGQPSTAESVLQELAHDYPFPALILEHRTLSKLKSTYTDALPQQIKARTGRVHTSYQQAVTTTGRLSSTEPNLQNIPIRTLEGRRIRQAFVAPKGFKIVAADYSQIELRIMAHLSQDAGLLKAFSLGEDIHRATAAEVFGVPLADVSTTQRRNAKAINFGLIYGMSAFGLGKQLEIGRTEAQSYIDAYFARYPDVKKYMEETQAQAHEQGYVETVFGRRLYLPEINARNHQRRQYAERTAINAPMQGTAADIIKKAMIALHTWTVENPARVKMIMQVHDELVFEVADDFIEAACETIRQLMCSVAILRVPLLVEIGVGNNWDEAH